MLQDTYHQTKIGGSESEEWQIWKHTETNSENLLVLWN